MYYPSKTRKGISFYRFFFWEFQENQEEFFSADLPVEGLLKESKTVRSWMELACGLIDGVDRGGGACLVAIFPAVSPRLASAGWVEYNRHRLNGRSMERYKTPGIPSSPRSEAGQALGP